MYFQVIKEALRLGNPTFNNIFFKKSIENVAHEGMDCSFSLKSKQKTPYYNHFNQISVDYSYMKGTQGQPLTLVTFNVKT